MKRLSWRSILQRVEGRRITALWYGLGDGYLRLEQLRCTLGIGREPRWHIAPAELVHGEKSVEEWQVRGKVQDFVEPRGGR